MCSGRRLPKTTSASRARVTATLRRRSPPGLVQRTEVHRDAARLIRAVGQREQHDVPLLALHALEILDEDGLGRVVREERLEPRILPACLIQQVLDEGLLLGIESDDADRAVAVRPSESRRSIATASATNARASAMLVRAPARA